MPDYLSPGVYIQELEGPAPITGVSTSIAAFIGMAERGPLNIAIPCTGPGDYQRWFGGLLHQDEFADPVDPRRAHCYLPYAVAGFFNNAGQLAYVMRVLPDEATYASDSLFDRSGISPITSQLIRPAAQNTGTGTTAATGALIMLSPVPPASTATQASFIRIGDGSASEYLQIAIGGTSTVNDSTAVDAQLQLSHDKGTPTAVYARSVKGSAAYTLVADTVAGQTVITVNAPDPLNTFSDWLIELAGAGLVVVAVPKAVASLGGGHFSITLAQPLADGFLAATAVVNALAASPGAAYTALAGSTGPYTLNADAAAGATSISVHSPTDDLTTFTNFLLNLSAGAVSAVVAPTTVTNVGGGNYTVALAAPLPSAFTTAAPTSVTALSSTPVAPLDLPASGGDVVLFIAGGSGLTGGDLIDIDPGNPMGREVRTIGALTLLSLAQATGADWPAKSLITPVTLTSAAATSLTADAKAGTQILSLTSRSGISAGTVLLLGTSPAQEYAVVLAVQGTRAFGADPGSVVLDEALVGAYVKGSAVVPASVSATVPAGRRATSVVLDTPAGSSTTLVSWFTGWAVGDLLQVALPDGTIAYNEIVAPPAKQALEAVALVSPVQTNHPAGAPVVSRSRLIQVQALDAGAWGLRVALSVQDENPGLVSSARVVTLIGAAQLKLSTLTGIQPGSYLELLSPTGTVVDPSTPLKVNTVNLSTTTITLDNPISALQTAAIGLATTVAPVTLRSREFRVTAYLYRHPDAAVPSRNTQVIQSEVFANLSMDPRHSRYFQRLIGPITGPLRLSDRRTEGTSMLIRTEDKSPSQVPRLGPEALIDVLPNGLERPARHRLTEGGDDSLATVSDDMYIGVDDPDPVSRTGIFALLNVPQISIVAIPGQATPGVQSALIDHCENALYRFAVLDPQYPDSAIADIQAQRQAFDTKFAAIYYPWLTIPDPFPTNLNSIADFPVPPSGPIVGIYARVDDSRGVFKAPANEVVLGITGLTARLVKGDQDILNPSPSNINVIRDFRHDGRGIRVWGARIMTSDDNFKYVPVKRLMMFIEQSLDVGLQDIVFEPNAPPLWASVERLISNFLTTVWAAGGLQGATAEQSFFVRCDLTTMTQTDIDAGRLIALVGVAPVKPAEFVIIQISLTIPATST